MLITFKGTQARFLRFVGHCLKWQDLVMGLSEARIWAPSAMQVAGYALCFWLNSTRQGSQTERQNGILRQFERHALVGASTVAWAARFGLQMVLQLKLKSPETPKPSTLQFQLAAGCGHSYSSCRLNPTGNSSQNPDLRNQASILSCLRLRDLTPPHPKLHSCGEW